MLDICWSPLSTANGDVARPTFSRARTILTLKTKAPPHKIPITLSHWSANLSLWNTTPSWNISSILYLPHSRNLPPRALTHTPLPPYVSHTHYLTASHLKKKAPSTRFIFLLTSNERNRRTHTLIVNQKWTPPGQFSRNDPRTKKDYDSCLRQH